MKTAITWLLLCVSLISTAVQASTDSPETGMFLFRSDDGSWQPALLLNTDMQVQVSGPVAEVQIRQSFSNPGVAFAEGRYVLPTSEGAAVHAMTLEIGERRINGVIQEREQARKTYEQARDNGQQTGLVEQERPNLFTTSVANIGAGETISVILSYTELLQPDAGRYSLRLPLTIESALERMEQCKDIEAVLGSKFCRGYVAVKRAEHENYKRVISSWEREFLLLSV